jgi:arylsulfatase A-like enzyme
MKINPMVKTTLFAAGVWFATSLTAAQANNSKPNIIFILADDLGFGDVGFNGQSKIKTPNIGRMAQNGAVMTNFYAGAPVCGPSRATLLYGQHTGHVPIRGNPRWTKSGKAPVLKQSDILLSKELKNAGYNTAVFGKWAMNENVKENSGHPFKHGFDEFVGFNTHMEAHYHWPDYVWDGNEKIDLSKGEKGGNWKNRLTYADDLFTVKTLDYIERKAGEKPFFIYLNYTAPHKGYTSPNDSKEPYESLDWPIAKGKKGHYEMDPDMNTAYAGMIARMDSYIGQIFKKLKEKNIEDTTLVFFTSDNGHEIDGDFFKSGGEFRGRKRDVTDGGIHMPTAVVWPDVVKPGTKIDTNLAFWDVLSTFCDIASVNPSGETDGISFYPALRGEMSKQKEHDYLYWEFNESNGPMQAIRFKDWKAIRLWDKKKNMMGPIQLYNIEKDKGEKNDLASKMPELAGVALKIIEGARTAHPEFPLEPTRKEKAKGKKKQEDK